jgi:hypothetical protein
MRALAALALVLLASSAHADDDAPLSVRYELNANQVAQGDTFQLDVVVSVRTQDPVEELSLPDLPRAFTVLQERRGSSTNITAVNGRRVILVEQRYMYLLRADEVGSFKIPEATARLGKSVARAAPVVVKVVGADTLGDAPPDDDGNAAAGPMPGARFGKNLPATFLEVTLDRTSAWVGQQVTATTEVYTQQPLAQWPRLPSLKPPGFFCTSLLGDDRPAPTQRTIGGRVYYVYLVNKDALFALGAGDKQIPSQSVDLLPAGSFFSRSREITARSSALKVEVKALPTQDQPEKFPVGNVGHWTLAATVKPSRGALGQPLTLTLTATGTGSLEQLELPSWDGNDQARVFPAATKREPRAVSATDPELGGRVTVDLLVQPQKEGQLRIPAFTLSTFDPDTGTYKQSTTQPLVVPIGAAGSVASSASAVASSAGRQVIAKGTRPLKKGVDEVSPPGDAPVAGAALVFVAGLGAYGAGTLRRRRAGSAAGQRATLRKDRQKAFDEARGRGDLASLERLLLDALAEACGPSVKGVATSELAALLVDKGLEPALADDVVRFIRDVEAARYMGAGSGGERKQLADTAGVLLAKVETKEARA